MKTALSLLATGSVLTLVSLLGLAGCAAEASDGGTSPEGASADEDVSASEEAVSGAPSNNGYFIVTRRDFRRCVAPLCGGFYVKRVNDAKTRCADGSLQSECYVSEIQLSGVGLSTREEDDLRGAVESGKALVKARLYKHRWNATTLGKLKATEGWLGATGSTPDGTFYRTADNELRCVRMPCPSIGAYGLNTAEDHNVIRVNLGTTATPADADVLARAERLIGTREGILVAGGVALPKCLPGSDCGPFVTASEFYLRVVRREGRACGGLTVEAQSCNAGQFCQWASADMCGAADAPGVCSYKPDVCNKLFAPVCGCDGQTYGNACEAHASGTSVAKSGTCVPAPKP